MPHPAPTAWRRSRSYAWRRSPARTATATAPMGSCASPTLSRPSTPRPSATSWLPSTSWPTASTRSSWSVTARTSWRRYIAVSCRAPCWRGVSASPRRCGRDATTATPTSAATTPASFRPTTRTRWSRSWLQPDHRLAGVVAGEQGVEGVDGRLQPLVDVGPVLELAVRHPLPQPAGHLREPIPVVERQEPLHRRPAVDELEVVGRSGRTPLLVVDRDRAAQHHPSVHRQAIEHRIEDGPAHVVEVDVDPVRAQLLQARVQVVGPVVDGAIEPKVVEEPPRLVVGPTDPDHPATVDLGDLGGQRTGRPRSRRHDHRLARLHPTDVDHPHVGGEARGAVDGQQRRGVDLLAHGRGQPPPDAAGAHRLADLDRWQVALGLGQPGADRGVDADPVDLQQRLPIVEAGERDDLL